VSLREIISQRPGRIPVVAGALLLVCVIVIALQLRGSSSSVEAGPAQAYFTVDDGKTWFPANADKIPPFEKDGKEAVLAHVYRCRDGTKFVNYIERFKPDAKLALEKARAPDPTGKTRPDQSAVQAAYVSGREVKRPGDPKWVNAADYREAAKITAIKGPNGAADATPFEP
jgi:hypothetical protein